MNGRHIALAALTLALAAGCALSSGAGGIAGADGAPPLAARLFAPEPTWQEAGIRATGATPPGFVIALRADMPTPGYTLAIDEVAVDRAARRIVARVTETAPGGVVSQVITPTTLEIPVEPLERGTWTFELRTRRATGADHVPRHAVVLQAG